MTGLGSGYVAISSGGQTTLPTWAHDRLRRDYDAVTRVLADLLDDLGDEHGWEPWYYCGNCDTFGCDINTRRAEAVEQLRAINPDVYPADGTGNHE